MVSGEENLGIVVTDTRQAERRELPEKKPRAIFVPSPGYAHFPGGLNFMKAIETISTTTAQLLNLRR